MSDRTLTHKDLAAMTGVSVTTIKSYRRKFGEFIPVARFSKPIRFNLEAGPVCVRIRSFFAEGLPVTNIKKRLLSEFKVYSQDHHLPISESKSSEPKESPAEIERISNLLSDMLKGMGAMATAQANAEKRLASLEQSLKELLEFESRRSDQSLRFDEIAERLEKSALKPAPSHRGSMKRVVTVQARDGKKDSYILGENGESESEDAASSTGVSEFSSGTGSMSSHDLRKEKIGTSVNGNSSGRPSRDFLNLPVAMHSAGSDFLGINGPDGKPFSLAAFERHLLTRSGGPGFPSSTWRGGGDRWTCTISGQDKHSVNTMSFIRTRTKRGNIVAHLNSMEVNGKKASDAFLQAFFREIKSSLGG